MGAESSKLKLSDRVDNAQKTGVFALVGIELKKVPDEVKQLGSGSRGKALHTLNLSNNRIQTLPVWLKSFTGLKTVNLSHNRLGQDVIGALSVLPLLAMLDVSHNMIDGFDGSGNENERWPALKTLKISHNALSVVPAAWGRDAKHLAVIDASHNKVASFQDAESFGTLPLAEVDLSANVLSSLPSVFASCGKLKILNVGSNRLGDIPPSIFRNPALKTIALDGNPVCTDNKHLKLEGYDEYADRHSTVVKRTEG